MENRFRRSMRFIPTYVGHTSSPGPYQFHISVHPHIRGAYAALPRQQLIFPGSSPHTWGIPLLGLRMLLPDRFIPTHVGHTQDRAGMSTPRSVHPHLRGAYSVTVVAHKLTNGSSPPTWGIHWTAVRKMAGFSHFSYDFTRKSYFVQGLVFFGVIGAEAFPTHRRGRNQCLPGAHGGSVRNL